MSSLLLKRENTTEEARRALFVPVEARKRRRRPRPQLRDGVGVDRVGAGRQAGE